MNYKCSAQARLVLDQVAARCQKDSKTNNKWSGNSGSYMYIMGRENSDGKATGVVHKFQADGSHKLAGSFKILADGTITRFTGLSNQIGMNICPKQNLITHRHYRLVIKLP